MPKCLTLSASGSWRLTRKAPDFDWSSAFGGIGQAGVKGSAALIGELARQRIMMLSLGFCVAGLAMGGGLERALFVPSEIVAALQANPRVAAIDGLPQEVGLVQQAKKRSVRALPTISDDPVAPSTDSPIPPGPDAGSPLPEVMGQQFASLDPRAEPPLQPASFKAAGERPGVTFSIPSGPDIYGSTPVEPLPEPETWAMMGSGLAVAAAALRRRRRKADA